MQNNEDKEGWGRKGNASTLMRAKQCSLANLRTIPAYALGGLGQNFGHLQRALATPEWSRNVVTTHSTQTILLQTTPRLMAVSRNFQSFLYDITKMNPSKKEEVKVLNSLAATLDRKDVVDGA